MKALLAKIRSHVGLVVSAAMILGFISSGSLAFAQTTTQNNWGGHTSYNNDRDNDHDGDRDNDNDRDHDGDRDHDRDGHHGWNRHSYPRWGNHSGHHDWYRWRWMNNRYERYFDWMSYCQWFASVYGYLPSSSCPVTSLLNY